MWMSECFRLQPGWCLSDSRFVAHIVLKIFESLLVEILLSAGACISWGHICKLKLRGAANFTVCRCSVCGSPKGTLWRATQCSASHHLAARAIVWLLYILNQHMQPMSAYQMAYATSHQVQTCPPRLGICLCCFAILPHPNGNV